jgi:hypothetical protein
MIHPSLVTAVQHLLAEQQLSHRKIAAKTGVSRSSVGRIARGERPEYDDPGDPEDAPKVRCPGCGGLQTLPCCVCRDRTAVADIEAAARRTPGAEESEPDELNLELRPNHQARYEPIHARKASEFNRDPAGSEENSPADRAA